MNRLQPLAPPRQPNARGEKSGWAQLLAPHETLFLWGLIANWPSFPPADYVSYFDFKLYMRTMDLNTVILIDNDAPIGGTFLPPLTHHTTDLYNRSLLLP
jgi:hypothetical protein